MDGTPIKAVLAVLAILAGSGVFLAYNSSSPNDGEAPGSLEHISAEKQLARTDLGSESHKAFPGERRVLVGYREGQPEFGYNYTLDKWTAYEMAYIAENRVKQTLISELGYSAKNISVSSTSTVDSYRSVIVEYNINRSYPFSYNEFRDALPNGYTATAHFGNHSNTVQVLVAVETVYEPVYNLVNPRNQTQE